MPSSAGTRVRGRKGQAMRRRRLKLHPFCAECAKVGVQRLTAIIDHVRPLAFGGLDVDENTQGLCAFHDAVKTAAEQTSQGGVATHPDWLEPSAVPLAIVCGPPCGGKSTYVTEQAQAGDVVIDMDAIALSLHPGWDRRWNKAVLDQSMRVRNAMLGALSRQPEGRAWFVVSAPSPEERQWWVSRLGGSVILCDPGQAVATARAVARDGRSDHVDRWYRASRSAWVRAERERLPKAGADADGYPVCGTGSGVDD